jgi:hypothetical protein
VPVVLNNRHKKYYFWRRLLKTDDTKNKRGTENFGVTRMKSSEVEVQDRKFHGGVNSYVVVSSHFSSLSHVAE